MLGYVRPCKPDMRIREYDTYKAIYCGLCKELGKSFGAASRLTLSYDFAFLALLHLSVNDALASFDKMICVAHPFKKMPQALPNEALSYSASCAVLTIYHKVRDNIADSRLFRKLPPLALLPFAKGAYRKSARTYPAIAALIEEQIERQTALEAAGCASLDESADPTSRMMEAIAAGITENGQHKRILARFGYLLGRWIYLLDALDDVEKDSKQGAYNPLLLRFQVESPAHLTEEKLTEIRTFAVDELHLTMGELAGAYALLPIVKYRPILDNIVYAGLNTALHNTITKEKKNDGSL